MIWSSEYESYNDFLAIIEGTRHFENGILDIFEVIRHLMRNF